MQPQQPYQPYNPGPAPQPSQDQFQFIMQGPHKPKRSLFAANSMKQRLLLVGAATVLLIIIIAVVSSLLSSAGKSSYVKLDAIVNQQTKLITLADAGTKNSDPTIANLAITTKLSLETSQAQTLAYLGKQHYKIDTKKLAKVQDTDANRLLAAATEANTYDATYTKILTQRLDSYRQAVKDAYNGTNTKTQKQLLQSMFTQATILRPTE